MLSFELISVEFQDNYPPPLQKKKKKKKVSKKEINHPNLIMHKNLTIVPQKGNTVCINYSSENTYLWKFKLPMSNFNTSSKGICTW